MPRGSPDTLGEAEGFIHCISVSTFASSENFNMFGFVWLNSETDFGTIAGKPILPTSGNHGRSLALARP